MPRKKTVAPPEPPKPPTCSTCHAELTWRDALYGGRAREATDETPAVGPTCKLCNRKAQRQVLRGTLSVAMRVVEGRRGGKQFAPVVKRATRRVHVAASGNFATDRTVNWGSWILLKRARLERARKSQLSA